ncbi:hypothetical protein [Deinococcus misasensis]|uniref:hypothetical protein n=1 Tax=Deinococcus misasensis TaxID=392413 RepID=UPI000552B1FC|nr:hypothetical protein [Deinococcus misasensis]
MNTESNAGLPLILKKLLEMGSDSNPNPALTTLLNDDARHHFVLVVLGSVLVLGCPDLFIRFLTPKDRTLLQVRI